MWEMGGETYTKWEDFFFPYFLPGARGYQCLQPLASSSEMPLIGCVSLAWLRFSALCLNLTAWFSSHGLFPVIHLLYLTALIVLSSTCLLIKMWQLVKVHRFTRNEPKIHVICYITPCGVTHECSWNPFLIFFCLYSLNRRNVKPCGFFTFPSQVSFLPISEPLLHTACSWSKMCIFLFGYVCVFFLLNTIGMFIMYIKCQMSW